MPIGAGFAPGGSVSAGYGVPDSAHVPIKAIFPDLRTGLPQTGRYINPVTKDYRFTSDGRYYGFGTVPQLVFLALTTVRGSCCIKSLGQTFTQIQEQGTSYPQQLSAAVSSALSSLIRAGLVQLVSVTTQQLPSNPDAATNKIVWRDLTTGTFYTGTIGP